MPGVAETTDELTFVAESQVCGNDLWEEAYKRFETPDEEIQKFCSRLLRFGVDRWDTDVEIVELFCGRGNALVAWQQLGFDRLEGVDLSASLLSEYQGPARCYVADCRELPFDDHSKDVLAMHGGLHHLPELKQDLPCVLDEVVRVLRPGGRILVVEPWDTPFLQLVHYVAANPIVRQAWDKMDAFHQLYENEQVTYDRWREHPDWILGQFYTRFEVEHCTRRWGKLNFLGSSIAEQWPANT